MKSLRIDAALRRHVSRALREDLSARGDVTTRGFLPPDKRYIARIVAKQDGILCGSRLATEAFRQAAPSARVKWTLPEGAKVRRGLAVARITGGRDILTAERTALNYLQHLSGIATLTRAYVEQTRRTSARIYDTRKTLPGWRVLAKYAVRAGGGFNHRMGLYDMALLKDNHLEGWRAGGDGLKRVRQRILSFRRRYPKVPIEIEASDRSETRLALDLGADLILLDNMTPALLKKNIAYIRKHKPGTLIEVSGGVALSTVGKIARLGPDRISVGKLTHSAPALDFSLKI